jgi:hypothetical protein
MPRQGFVDIAEDIISNEVADNSYRPIDGVLRATVRRMLRRGVDPRDISASLLVKLDDVIEERNSFVGSSRPNPTEA